MSNVEILKQGYQYFAEGNIEAVTSQWNEDIIWDECTGFPQIEGDGIFVGAKAIMEGVFAKIPENMEGFNVEITDFVDGGDKVVMVGYYKGKWKQTGKDFKANATHVWTFKNGKVSHFFQAVDTAEIVNP